MAYQDRFGSTDIRKGRRDNLIVSWDYDADPNQRHPVLLYTPDIGNKNVHFHIELSRRQAKILRDWLTEFLDE